VRQTNDENGVPCSNTTGVPFAGPKRSQRTSPAGL